MIKMIFITENLENAKLSVISQSVNLLYSKKWNHTAFLRHQVIFYSSSSFMFPAEYNGIIIKGLVFPTLVSVWT